MLRSYKIQDSEISGGEGETPVMLTYMTYFALRLQPSKECFENTLGLLENRSVKDVVELKCLETRDAELPKCEIPRSRRHIRCAATPWPMRHGSSLESRRAQVGVEKL